MSYMSGIGEISGDDLFVSKIGDDAKEQDNRDAPTKRYLPICFRKLGQYEDNGLDNPYSSSGSRKGGDDRESIHASSKEPLPWRTLFEI